MYSAAPLLPGATPLPPTGLDMLQAYRAAPESLKSLLVADETTFCYRCHEQQDVVALSAHKDTAKACTECHDPHQSDREHLLR